MNGIQKRSDATWGGRDKIFDEIELAVNHPKSLLDVGCGSDSPVQFLKERPERLIGIDGFPPSIEVSRTRMLHDKYLCLDLNLLDKAFPNEIFDCVMSLDVIEHFEKDQGLKLIKDMEGLAQKRVVILTPNGFLPQSEHSGNAYQKHRSGWTVNEMEALGYKVIGVNGWKPLLGQYAQPNFWPKRFWRLISRLTQPLVRNNPNHAFHLLCIKTIE